MITTEQYDRLKPHRDFIISKRSANSFYGLEHQSVWRVIHAMWFEMKNISLDGNCFDCVQTAYNNFADYITMYEIAKDNYRRLQEQEAAEASEEEKPEPAKRGRKPKSK